MRYITVLLALLLAGSAFGERLGTITGMISDSATVAPKKNVMNGTYFITDSLTVAANWDSVSHQFQETQAVIANGVEIRVDSGTTGTISVDYRVCASIGSMDNISIWTPITFKTDSIGTTATAVTWTAGTGYCATDFNPPPFPIVQFRVRHSDSEALYYRLALTWRSGGR